MKRTGATAAGLNTPPGLIGAALLFWGWEMQWLPGAVLLALLLESVRFLPGRLAWGEAEFNRLWDFTSVLALTAGLYFYTHRTLPSALLHVIQWLPLLLFPFLVLAACATDPFVTARTFFHWLQRWNGASGWSLSRPSRKVNPGYPFFLLCLLSASAVNARDLRFYAGICLLTGYGLWHARPRTGRGGAALVLFTLAMALGYFLHTWLAETQQRLERQTAWLLYGFGGRGVDDNEGLTAIGRIGEVKLSSRMMFEVEPEVPQHPPKLLRQAAFNRYSLGIWYGLGRTFESVPQDGTGNWKLAPAQNAPFSLTISGFLPGGGGLLILPPGCARISELPASELVRNRIGSVRVSGGPDIARYRPHFRPGFNLEESPNKYDTQVPANERAAIGQVAQELKLGGLSPRQVLRTLDAFFQRDFQYRVYFPASPKPASAKIETPLAKFLLHDRAGHCEYFATAATLLLRQCGIPARYATGFSLQESARLGNRYFVRERHAHAWALAYVDGTWVDFDATPISWEESEDQRAPWSRALRDWWTLTRFQFAQWQTTYRPGELVGYAAGLMLVLAGLWTWRRFPHQRRQHAIATTADRIVTAWPGQDSEFFLVEERLGAAGLRREPHETFAMWLRRLQDHAGTDSEALRSMLALHYRCRFDPDGVGSTERAVLAQNVHRWLSQHPAPAESKSGSGI